MPSLCHIVIHSFIPSTPTHTLHRALWDAINSAAMERQSSLEESLLSLGEFEDAYSELWAWLTDALRQLGEAEPITGDPDMVAAQLARHKVHICSE